MKLRASTITLKTMGVSSLTFLTSYIPCPSLLFSFSFFSTFSPSRSLLPNFSIFLHFCSSSFFHLPSPCPLLVFLSHLPSSLSFASLYHPSFFSFFCFSFTVLSLFSSPLIIHSGNWILLQGCVIFNSVFRLLILLSYSPSSSYSSSSSSCSSSPTAIIVLLQ